MTKREIAKRASEISGIPQCQILNCMEAIQVTIKEALSEKKKVVLHNFGTFFTKDMKSRISMNPRAQEKIFLQERSVVKFKISDSFKFKE